MADETKEFPVLSIDAWREAEGGWTWNQWWKVATLSINPADLSKPRKLLKAMREDGPLSFRSAGKLAIEDDGYNIVIMAKGTREPFYAIEYGSVLK